MYELTYVPQYPGFLRRSGIFQTGYRIFSFLAALIAQPITSKKTRLKLKLDRKQWVLIQRYVTGNAGPAERERVESWMAEAHENRRIIQDVRDVWNRTPPEDFDVDVQQAWEQFRYRSQKNAIPVAPVNVNLRRGSNTLLYLFRAAAVLLVALFTGLFVHSQINTTEQSGSEPVSAFNVLQELETERGEKARVTFSDGTSVTLNSASRVRFPQEFHGTTRDVYLEGEAYFEVAHNPDQPFIVHSQDARIEVLGTTFNVRGWSEDPGVEVVVGGGKVSVQSTNRHPNEHSEVILTEGLKTEILKGQKPLDPVKVDPVHHLLWTNGGIHFDNEPFRGVVRDLERRFNVNITVEDKTLLDVPYTGTFQYAELNEILSVIAASLEVGYSRDGAEVEFF